MLAAVDCKHAPLNETLGFGFDDQLSLYDLCSEYLQNNDIHVQNSNDTVAIIMQGYQSFDLNGFGSADALPQDHIYNFYRCLNKNFKEYRVFDKENYPEQQPDIEFKTLSPLFQYPDHVLGGYNLCQPSQVKQY